MGKYADLTGKRSGKLVAIEPTEEREVRGSVIWKCKCDCGKTCFVSTKRFRKVKSCGCLIKKHDLTGQRFGFLTVLYKSDKDTKNIYWHCKCDCGNEKDTAAHSLISGMTKSCGCYHNKVLSDISTTHGLSKTRICRIYYSMKNRCYNPNNRSYANYGGRGIGICQEWLGESGVESFIKWSISHGYEDGLTIDRINVDKDYSPRNCRWVTKAEQTNNTRRTVWIEISGIKKNLKQWTNFMGWKYGKYSMRNERGSDIFTKEEIEQIKNKIMEVEDNE